MYEILILPGMEELTFTQESQYANLFTSVNVIFFLSGFSFTDTGDSQDRRGREGTIFYSTLSFPPAHQHSDISCHFQLFMLDDYHLFLIAPFVFTRLLHDEIYDLIELPFD